MLRYFETTTLILLWCALLAFAVAGLAFWRAARRPRGSTPKRGGGVPGGAALPALVLAPIALTAGFRLFGINLLYPVHVLVTGGTLLFAAIVPAFVLAAASGLLGQIWRSVPAEYEHWRGKTFATVALAVGRDVRGELRRLVMLKALAGAWSQALPWLFGELVIVETVFNAPGLGLDAWHLARTRDLTGLAQSVVWLSALYLLCFVVTAGVHRWIGRRLDTYA